MTEDISVEELRQRYPYVFAWGAELGSDLSYVVDQARAAYRDGQPEDVLTYAEWEQLDSLTRSAILSDRRRATEDGPPVPRAYVALALGRPDATPYRVWWRVGKLVGERLRRVQRRAQDIR